MIKCTMKQDNTTITSLENQNELSLPLLFDDSINCNVGKQKQVIENEDNDYHDEHRCEKKLQNAFVLGIPVGFLIVMNAYNIELAVLLLTSNFHKHQFLTNAQIKKLMLYIAVSVGLVVAVTLFSLSDKFTEERKKKFLCYDNRLSLLAGLLFGNIVGIATTFYPFYDGFLSHLMIVTLFASSIFSIMICMRFRYYLRDDEEKEPCDSENDSK